MKNSTKKQLPLLPYKPIPPGEIKRLHQRAMMLALYWLTIQRPN